MSHADGQIKFQDGTILFCEFDGTADVMLSCLYDSPYGVQKMWRAQPHHTCSCGNDEPVEMATKYACGFYWQGRACKNCRAITGGAYFGIDTHEYTSRLPDWWSGE